MQKKNDKSYPCKPQVIKTGFSHQTIQKPFCMKIYFKTLLYESKGFHTKILLNILKISTFYVLQKLETFFVLEDIFYFSVHVCPAYT